jgi:hypothetical protein
MKKTALTFGLFSLAMVATSFATPQSISTPDKTTSFRDIDNGGVITGRDQGRKVDFHATTNELKINNKSEGFRQDRQSLGSTIKLD